MGVKRLPRKLFSELGPWAYAVAVKRKRLQRHLRDAFRGKRFAADKAEPLPVLIYEHKSLIRRRLGNVDMTLQENKAVNLSLAAPSVDGILIRPGETFSFWRLVGQCTARKGYREGLTITRQGPSRGIGGGMCQFTNLLHWMTLHSPLTICEHHHHDTVDLFPDFNRQVPFGVGTSIFYNYLDYRVYNPTKTSYQFRVWVTGEHLCGELRAETRPPVKYHIVEEDRQFTEENGAWYRRNAVYRSAIDVRTGNETERTLLKRCNARVMYELEDTFVKDAALGVPESKP